MLGSLLVGVQRRSWDFQRSRLMATSQPVIPPLGEKQRIADWRIIFEACTETIRAQEGGEKRVIQMLPAYINRSFEDRECVREVVKSAETAREALDDSATTLDPPTDKYSARQTLCRLTWQPGESIDYLFYKPSQGWISDS